MTEPELFKKQVIELLNQVEKIDFLGDFDDIVKLLTEIKEKKMLDWVQEVVKKNIQPIVKGSNKKYKLWKQSDLLIFRYPFSINNNEYRVLIVKIKSSSYIEFHIGNHKYYDDVMEDLGKKS